MNKSPAPRKPTLSSRRSIVPPKGFRKSQVQLTPINVLVSNNRYYNYSLERISYPNNSGRFIITAAPNDTLRVKKRESVIKEPLILSYQKVNIISYKIAHTAFIEGENINTDHVCKLDLESMRCSLCGCHMGWMFTRDGMRYEQPLRIDYYDFETVFFEEKFGSDSFVSLKPVRNLAIMRKFLSYIVDRPVGLGFQELFEKYRLINLFPVTVYKELGISYRELIERKNEDFRIFADFEGANLQSYFYSREGETFRLRLAIRGDSNVENGEDAKTLWFFFKVQAKRTGVFEFEIVNLSEKGYPWAEDKGVVFVRDEGVPDGDEAVYSGEKRWRILREKVVFGRNLAGIPGERISMVKRETIQGDPESKPQGLDEPSEIKASEEALTGRKRGSTMSNPLKRRFFNLRFSYVFARASKASPEEALFSFAMPYSYTELLAFFSRQEKRLFSRAMQEQEFELKSKRILLRNDLIHYERIVVGNTRCGVPIFLLKITASKSAEETDWSEYFPNSGRKKKKAVVIFARQHPYETATSFVAEGLISALLNEQKKANVMRMFFTFFVVPMINADGVMAGNTVTSISGNDLNRIWNAPVQDVHPEIFQLKAFFASLKTEVSLFIDLHATTQNSGVFLYGNLPLLELSTCTLTEENVEKYQCDLAESLLFPRVFKAQSRYFDEKQCRGSIIDKEKEGTARNVFHRELRITHCYSLITSQYNYNDPSDSSLKELRTEDFRNIGKDCLSSIFSFLVIVAETWVQNEKKAQALLKSEDSSNIIDSSGVRRRKAESPGKSPKDAEKQGKIEEKERYFYHHLQKAAREIETNLDWKRYFTEKELIFMRQKAKKRLIPLTAFQPKKKGERSEGEGENNEGKALKALKIKGKKGKENDISVLMHSILAKYQDGDAKSPVSHASEDFFKGDISIESDEPSPLTPQIGKNGRKGENMINFYKDQMKKAGLNEKSSKARGFLQLNSSEENVGVSKSGFGGSSGHNETTQTGKIDKSKIDKSLSLHNKSLSFYNKSTARINEGRLFKNKSNLNLRTAVDGGDIEGISSLQVTASVHERADLARNQDTADLARTLLFKRAEFLRKIREKLKSDKEIQLSEFKKLKIPIRKHFKKEDEPASPQITSTNNGREDFHKLKWRLKRPCSQGLIPINPFIKHKKELIEIYSLHQRSGGSIIEKNIRGNEGNRPYLQARGVKKDRKTASLSPWTQRTEV